MSPALHQRDTDAALLRVKQGQQGVPQLVACGTSEGKIGNKKRRLLYSTSDTK